MEVETLIEEMQKVKQAHPTLEIQDVLRIFQIKTNIELANQLRRMANN